MQRLDVYARAHGAEGNPKKQQGVVIEAPSASANKKGRKKR
jgi:hypothetical protein